MLDVSAAPARDPTGVISGGVVVARDITQARLIARQLSHQATHDALTGLVNRGEFERRLARALAGAAAEHSQHAVCFLDLDGFKRINDACGHLAGDELLKQLSDVMRERMRARDTLARLGGDEFGLLLEHCGLPRAQRIADAIRHAIGADRFTFGAETYAVGVSIGIVPVRPGVHRPGDVLKAADAACYRAKRSGGHRVQVSTGSHRSAEAPPAAAWSRRLLLALERGLFRLYAQPLRSLGRPGAAEQGFELLLRLDEGEGVPLAGLEMKIW